MPVPFIGYVAVGGLAALAIYKFHEDSTAANNPDAPQGKQSNDFFSDWFDGGGQPATGNGQNTASGVANAVKSLADFGTHLVDYWGTHDDAADSGSTGASGYGTGGGVSYGDDNNGGFTDFVPEGN